MRHCVNTELVQDGGVKFVAGGNVLDGLAADFVTGAIVIGSVQPSGFAELPQAPRHPMVNTVNVIVVAWLSGSQISRYR
jgi:Flp pilus assembly protein TadG